MITKLTKSQERKMYEYRDEGLRIGRDTTPINHSELEDALVSLYTECGLDSNLTFIYSNSPKECVDKILKDKRSNIRSNIESNIRSNIESNIWSNIESNIESNIRWGQYEINWVQYYAYYNNVVGFKANNQKLLKLLINLTKNSHILFLYDTIVYVSERPVKMSLNEIGQLHSFDQSAFEYADGEKMYFSNGVRMPEKYIKTVADKISVATILKEENSEIRRELLRKVGIDNFIKKCKSKPIDKSEDGIYEMYKIKLGKDKTGTYLKMKNPSIDTYHFEGVIDSCDTIEKALAWRDSEEEYIKPIELT